jgi:predicted Zn-ribbon and HTH transcriptional regulator
MTKYKCKRCGYEWKSRVEKPLTCPRCKRYDYNSDYEKLAEVVTQ